MSDGDYDNKVICWGFPTYLDCKENWAVSYEQLFAGETQQFANDVMLEARITPVKHNGGVLLLELPDYLPLLRAIKRESREYSVANDWPELECTRTIDEVLDEYS